MLQHELRRADLHDAAQIHDRHAIGHGPCEPQIVRHDQDRDLQVVSELQQQREDLAAHRGVEIRHGLVRHDDLRIEGERRARALGERSHELEGRAEMAEANLRTLLASARTGAKQDAPVGDAEMAAILGVLRADEAAEDGKLSEVAPTEAG